MDLSDLSAEALAAHLGARPLRTYPALLSTDAEALAWARSGAPEGAVVVAGYQASPRGRGGKIWDLDPARNLGFSLVVRPQWPAFREGWLYTVVVSALADVIGTEATIEWPDEVRVDGRMAASVGVYVDLAERLTSFAVATALVVDAPMPRGPLLARLLTAIDSRYRADSDAVIGDYLPRCETIGRRVRACMVPLGPLGPVSEGRAVSTLLDGSLVLETDEGRRIAARPQHLAVLEEASIPTAGSSPAPQSPV